MTKKVKIIRYTSSTIIYFIVDKKWYSQYIIIPDLFFDINFKQNSQMLLL